jgi:hypothetical protein
MNDDRPQAIAAFRMSEDQSNSLPKEKAREMNRADINQAISNIMLGIEADSAPMPTFTDAAKRDAWKQEMAAIDRAGKQAFAELAGDLLANIGSIAISLRKMAEPSGKPLFGDIMADSSQAGA